jgi:ubiquinone/menaquinone biosynthesis C-methylase UbiE
MTAKGTTMEGRLAYETGESAHGELLRPGGMDLTARAIEHGRLKPGARVLDVGCGAGTSSRFMQQVTGLNVTGLDISACACERTLAENDRACVVQGNAACLPFATASMDAVIAECTLSLIKDKGNALAECFRVLNGPGRLLITDMYVRNPRAAEYLRALIGTCLSEIIVREDFEAELASQGFLVELWEDHSDVLKQLWFQLLMGNGLQQLWTGEGANKDANKEKAQTISEALKVVRPGYFLLVAAKKTARCLSEKGEQL